MILADRSGTGYQQAPFNQLLNIFNSHTVHTLALVLSTGFTFHKTQVPSFWFQPKYSKLKLFQTRGSNQTTVRTWRQKTCFPNCFCLQHLPCTSGPYKWKYLNLGYNSGLATHEPCALYEKKAIPSTVTHPWKVLRIKHRWWGGKQFITSNILCRLRSYLWPYFWPFASLNIGLV